jgi:hypothetical protein
MAVMRTAAAGALATAVLASASPAWAQKPIPGVVRMMEPHRLRIGDYVRVWPTADGPYIQGPVVAVSASTLTITGPEEAVLVDLPTSARMEVRRTRSHAKRGALIGAGLGLVAGSFLITRELLGREVDTGERIGWMAGLTVVGAGAGAGIARLTQSVKWQPVDLVTLRPQTTDTGPGLRLSWTIRF